MADFWDSLNSSAPTAGGNDPAAITSYFQQKTGRAPTDDELARMVNGTPNWQAEIDANVAAPNGYANLLQTGNVQGTPATGNQFGATPGTYTPDAAASGILRSQYVAPQFSEPAPVFTAPTGVTMENDPGYQFRVDQAGQAVQRSAASHGTVLNPGTVSALAQRVGDQATAEYGNVFNRSNQTFQNALATYGAKYGVFQGNAAAANEADTKNKTAAQQTIANGKDAYATNFNANETAQTDYWNRLKDVSGVGAGAAAA